MRIRISLKAIFRLQSKTAVLLAIVCYTTLWYLFLSPTTQTVPHKEGSSIFLSTDLQDPLRSSLQHAILNAKKSVLLIIYSLNDVKIIGALNHISKKDVSVTVIYDKKASPEADFMLRNQITTYAKKGRGLMHLKLLVIDHTVAWIGSANMTISALIQQGNMMTGLRIPLLAERIEAYSKNLIAQKPFLKPVFRHKTQDQTLSLFLHPQHAKESLHELIQRIQKASRRIFIAMYTFTHPQLIQAICTAKKNGIDVRVIFDQHSLRETSKKAYLQCKKSRILCGHRKKAGLLHYKVAIIDDTIVTGSCNWTKAGFTSNTEAILIIDPLSHEQKAWVERWWHHVEALSSLPQSQKRMCA